MGEAKRKRRLMATEWSPLFSPDGPARIAISRPSARPETTRRLEFDLGLEIFRALQTGLPQLCFDPECDNELRSMPELRIFIRTGDAPPIAMGVCTQCARQGDAALRAIAQKIFKTYGLDGGVKGGIVVHTNLPTRNCIVEGVEIAVRMPDDDTICGAAQAFIELLEAKRLPRFMALRHGTGNCHALVGQLYLDMKEAGVESLFTFKRGSSVKLQCAIDPEGLHSWIEVAGWVIDASNGALRPVNITPVGEFYDFMELVDVHDIIDHEV